MEQGAPSRVPPPRPKKFREERDGLGFERFEMHTPFFRKPPYALRIWGAGVVHCGLK